jgi:hypothetical protein
MQSCMAICRKGFHKATLKICILMLKNLVQLLILRHICQYCTKHLQQLLSALRWKVMLLTKTLPIIIH